MFPASNPISHVIPARIRESARVGAQLPFFVFALDRALSWRFSRSRIQFPDLICVSLAPMHSVARTGSAVTSPAAHGAWTVNLPHSPEDAIWNRTGFHLYVSSLQGRRLRFPNRRVLTRVLRPGTTQIHLCAILGTFPRDSFLFRPVPPSFRNPPILYSFYRLKSIYRLYRF